MSTFKKERFNEQIEYPGTAKGKPNDAMSVHSKTLSYINFDGKNQVRAQSSYSKKRLDDRYFKKEEKSEVQKNIENDDKASVIT